MVGVAVGVGVAVVKIRKLLKALRDRLRRNDIEQSAERPKLVIPPTDRDNTVSLRPYVDFTRHE